jgi:hypothetical protein
MFGLPAGENPWIPEAIGRPDTIAGTLEAVLVIGLVGRLRGWTTGRIRSPRLLALGAALALSAVFVGTVVAITPDADGQLEAHGHADADEHATGHDHGSGTVIIALQTGAPR